jgi:chorismate mutase
MDFELVNVTEAVRKAYLELLPKVCRPGDDGQYGSSVEHDVYALQALSRRIHYGALYVAECKYREHPEEYGELAAIGDRPALMRKLTRRDVEERIVERVGAKVAALQAGVNAAVRVRVEPEVVTQFYRDAVIPLTKESEVRYMLHRQHSAPPAHPSAREGA